MGKKIVGYIKTLDPLYKGKTYESYETLGFDIEKVKMGDYVKGTGKFCPALRTTFKNLYMIRSPYDLHLKHHFQDNGFSWIEVMPDSSIKGESFDSVMSINSLADRNDIKHPLIQLILPTVVISDDDIEMQVLPPLTNYSKLPGLTIGGVINVRRWHRTLNWFFEWHDTDNPIKIKRGDPLLFLKFTAKDRDDIIEIRKIKNTNDIDKSIRICQDMINTIKVNSDEIMDLHLKSRKKYLIKSHIRIILERLHLV